MNEFFSVWVEGLAIATLTFATPFSTSQSRCQTEWGTRPSENGRNVALPSGSLDATKSPVAPPGATKCRE